VLVCIGVVDVDELETGVVDQAAPCGVREDAEEVWSCSMRRGCSGSRNAIAKSTLFAGPEGTTWQPAGRRRVAVAMATPARRAALRRPLRTPRDPDQGGASAPNFGACEARGEASLIWELHNRLHKCSIRGAARDRRDRKSERITSPEENR
jgi:hypothetical protein